MRANAHKDRKKKQLTPGKSLSQDDFESQWPLEPKWLCRRFWSREAQAHLFNNLTWEPQPAGPCQHHVAMERRESTRGRQWDRGKQKRGAGVAKLCTRHASRRGSTTEPLIRVELKVYHDFFYLQAARVDFPFMHHIPAVLWNIAKELKFVAHLFHISLRRDTDHKRATIETTDEHKKPGLPILHPSSFLPFFLTFFLCFLSKSCDKGTLRVRR